MSMETTTINAAITGTAIMEITNIHNRYLNEVSNGFFPVFGFKGEPAYAGEAIGVICQGELDEFGCDSYYGNPDVDSVNNINSMSMVYGFRLSFTSYSILDLELTIPSDLKVYMNEVYSLLKTCQQAEITSAEAPGIYFVCGEERFFEYFGNADAADFQEPNIRDKDTIHIYGGCKECCRRGRVEFVGNDYHSSIDYGYRSMMVDGEMKGGKLPAAVHPL